MFTTAQNLELSTAGKTIDFRPTAFKAILTEENASYFLRTLDISESSKKTYLQALRQVFNYFNNHNIMMPTRDDLLGYKQHLIDTVSATTGQRYLSTAKQFFSRAEIEGIMNRDIGRGVKGIKTGGDIHRKDSLTRDQIIDVLGAINSPRDKAIFTLMITGGLRCVEIVRANQDDIQTRAGKPILFLQGKGSTSKDDYIVLDHHTHKTLLAYLGSRDKETMQAGSPLFISEGNRNKGGRLSTISISRLLKGYFRQVGIDSPRITAHSTRHSTAQLSAELGIDVRKTQALMRHKQITTTQIYFDQIDKLKDQTRTQIASFVFGQCKEITNS